MKKLIAAILVTSFMMLGSVTGHAQTTKPMHRHHRTTMTTTTNTNTVSSVGSEANVPPEGKSEAQMRVETAGDPLYLNHPYFNGEARWTNTDSLYKHGDFPYALMQKYPDHFRYNSDSGQWEMLSAPQMGSSTQTR